MAYSLVYTDRFNDCITEYAGRDARYLAELMEAVSELAKRPFGNPKLQTHAMKGVKGEKRFISYVGGSKGRRLIWSRFNRALVLLLYGEHDIEEQAERLAITYDGDTDGLTITERSQTPEEAASWQPDQPSDEPGQLFMAWTDDELAAMGFGDHEVPVLRRLDTQDELLDLDMADESFELAYNLLAYQDPAGPTPEKATEVGTAAVEEKVRELRSDEVVAEQQVAEPAARKHFLPISTEELEDLLAAPVEDWMVFLHPDQADLVERSFSGPARVRGAAGTGKTVVGLHRARHLAATYDASVLFSTYVRNLPPVFEQLYRRLERTGAGRVDFLNLHKVAYRLVADAGENISLNPDATDSAFAAAWQRVTNTGSSLTSLGLTRGYMREEIDWVIKGRGLVDLDQYLQLPRTGRGTPLNRDAREDAWQLYMEYEHQLRQRDATDFNDLLNRAIELLVLGRAVTPYRAVVLDEAQDLTEMGLRLAHLLAGGDQSDGLFLLGDGQQSVYPGGFNLANIGIDIRGRSSLLKVNYRNPRAIADLASRLVSGTTYEDLDTNEASSDRNVDIVRDGGDTELSRYPTETDHDTAMIARIDDLAARDDTGAGDIAVLVPTNAMVNHYASLIADLGLRTQKLQSYDGTPNDMVKVGTYQRGKGLEFKRVFLPRLDADGINEPRRPGEDEATHAERLERTRRQVYVAITRARDGVWLGWVSEPATLLAGLAHSRPTEGA